MPLQGRREGRMSAQHWLVRIRCDGGEEKEEAGRRRLKEDEDEGGGAVYEHRTRR